MDSKLQIISGKYRGRRLILPPDARPTQNRARIALFNMLESGIINPTDHMCIWDAFAGSGAFGLECVSRYPDATVVFTDTAASSVRTITDNIKRLGEHDRCQIIQADAVGSTEKIAADADLIFVDPPYAMRELGDGLVRRAANVVKSGTVLIWEQEIGHEVAPNADAWEVLRDKTYGRARFLILRKN